MQAACLPDTAAIQPATVVPFSLRITEVERTGCRSRPAALTQIAQRAQTIATREGSAILRGDGGGIGYVAATLRANLESTSTPILLVLVLVLVLVLDFAGDFEDEDEDEDESKARVFPPGLEGGVPDVTPHPERWAVASKVGQWKSNPLTSKILRPHFPGRQGFQTGSF